MCSIDSINKQNEVVHADLGMSVSDVSLLMLARSNVMEPLIGLLIRNSNIVGP